MIAKARRYPAERKSSPSTVVHDLTSSHRQPSESDVIHDHIRLRQYQIVAIACISVRIRTRHVKHAGPTESGETVGGSSGGSQLGPGGARPR